VERKTGTRTKVRSVSSVLLLDTTLNVDATLILLTPVS